MYFCLLEQGGNVSLAECFELLESCVCSLLVARTLAVKLHALGAISKDEIERHGRIAGTRDDHNATPVIAAVDEPSATTKNLARWPDGA